MLQKAAGPSKGKTIEREPTHEAASTSDFWDTLFGTILFIVFNFLIFNIA